MKKSFKQFHESNHEVIDNWLTIESIQKIWEDANNKVFGGQLTKPKFSLEDDLNYLSKRYKTDGEETNGYILGYCDKEGSNIILRFSRHISTIRELLEVVVHEMVHQAEAQSSTWLKMLKDPHGEKFLSWEGEVSKYHNLSLRQIIGMSNENI